MLNAEDRIASFYTGKRLLITGGRGYVGTSICKLLQDVSCQVIRISRSSHFEPIHGAIDVQDVVMDVCDSDVWSQFVCDVDVVIHLAGQTSVYKANEDPIADKDVNIMPLLHLLETCRKKNCCPIVLFAGTVTQAGMPKQLPVNEETVDCPVTVYDLHKLMAEQYLKYYAAQNYVKGVSLRLANVYGPGPKSSSADRGVLNVMVKKAIAGEDLSVYGTGEFLRDYVFVDDVARAFLFAGVHAHCINAKHFVIATGEGQTLKDAFRLIANRVYHTLGHRVSVVHVDPPNTLSPIENRNFVGDSNRFKTATKWQARLSLSDGIDHTIQAYSS